MNVKYPSDPPRRKKPAGFSLVEALISIVVVGVMLVAVLDTVGAAKAGQAQTMVRVQGHALAQALLSEAFERAYDDPDETPAFGREASEPAGPRSGFDDVDDYHNWSASPPEARDGIPLSEYANWKRTVIVEYVPADDLTKPGSEPSDTGLKRITVTVTRHDVVLASMVAVRSSSEARQPG